MNVLRNPGWLKQFQYNYTCFEEIPDSVFEAINENLKKVQSEKPVASVVITAWNEELTILNCIASLSQLKSDYPFEIIVVNNNSTDKTQEILDKLNIKSFFQPIQGCGPSRQLGQENALGEYILTGDADCVYPSQWINEMIEVLKKPHVVCVYGRYSFIAEKGYPRWKLTIFETLKDIVTEFRHLNRPYFNAYGLSMAYVKKYGLQVGFITINRRGEDGQLCLDLMQYGKIRQVRSNLARTWTGTRTLRNDGNILRAAAVRLIKEFKRFFFNLHSRLPEDKGSTNS